jgi:hypothetical protein
MIKSFVRAVRAAQKHLQVLLLVSFIGAALVAPAATVAQNLGAAPATGQAVQGQTASQPEGVFLNAVNLGLHRDLSCRRRHRRCRNRVAVAERTQLAAVRDDRWGSDLRIRHPAADRVLHLARSGGGVRHTCRHHWSSERFSVS